MKKFLTFVTVAGIMILASGCEVHTRTVYVPKKGSTTVVQATPVVPSTTVVVYEEDPYEEPLSDVFVCNEGTVIPVEWQCDGYNDCYGGDDENPKMCSTSVVVVEEYYAPEPSYVDHCEYVDWYGDEECCYDYDVQQVWLSPYEYVYEVCEYTTCVDYDFNILTEDSINCWYE